MLKTKAHLRFVAFCFVRDKNAARDVTDNNNTSPADAPATNQRWVFRKIIALNALLEVVREISFWMRKYTLWKYQASNSKLSAADYSVGVVWAKCLAKNHDTRRADTNWNETTVCIIMLDVQGITRHVYRPTSD